MNRTILSICGGSGCGKSALAIQLMQRLGLEWAVRIPTDFYLNANPYPSLAGFFQHPLQYDWDLLESVLASPDGTSISSPVYDFNRFCRVSIEGGRPFVLRPVIILDSMALYPRANITVLLQCPENERKRRIMERDQCWGTRVIDYWDVHQITLADMLSQKPHFDLELDGLDALADNVEKILSLPLFNERVSHQYTPE